MSDTLQDLIKSAAPTPTPVPKLKTKEQERFCCVLSNPMSFFVDDKKLSPDKAGFYAVENEAQRKEMMYQRSKGRVYLEGDLVPAVPAAK